MNTSNTSIPSESIILSTEQVDIIGSFPIFAFPGVSMLPIIEDQFIKKTEELETEELVIPKDIDILNAAKKYYVEHKETLLKKYKDKYIAILNNKIISSDKAFSKLAQRVYKKYGYQTIYMPFVEKKEKIVRIPSPKIK